MSSAADKLGKLKQIHDQRPNTDAEYEAKRSALVDAMLAEPDAYRTGVCGQDARWPFRRCSDPPK